jgi:small subunit ribosomal protein S7
MSRRKRNIKKRIINDAKYNDPILGKFMNIIMVQGKKSIAEKIIYQAFVMIEKITSSDPLKIFKKAIDKTRPLVEVRSRRVGGANYQVPVEVRPERALALSFRWLRDAAKTRQDKGMHIKLANELIDASNSKGEAIKKKDNMHKMAEANKAFAHYRW